MSLYDIEIKEETIPEGNLHGFMVEYREELLKEVHNVKVRSNDDDEKNAIRRQERIVMFEDISHMLGINPYLKKVKAHVEQQYGELNYHKR
jgi:hypothetical protein